MWMSYFGSLKYENGNKQSCCKIVGARPVWMNNYEKTFKTCKEENVWKVYGKWCLKRRTNERWTSVQIYISALVHIHGNLVIGLMSSKKILEKKESNWTPEDGDVCTSLINSWENNPEKEEKFWTASHLIISIKYGVITNWDDKLRQKFVAVLGWAIPSHEYDDVHWTVKVRGVR